MSRTKRQPRGSIAFVGIRGCALVEQVAAQYGMTAHALREKTRRQAVVEPRQHAMSALRAAGFTERAIATYFGLERSTISTGAARHEERAQRLAVAA